MLQLVDRSVGGLERSLNVLDLLGDRQQLLRWSTPHNRASRQTDGDGDVLPASSYEAAVMVRTAWMSTERT